MVVVKLQVIELYMGNVKNMKYKLKQLYDKLKKHHYNLYTNIHPYFVIPIYHSGMIRYTIASISVPCR